MIHALHVNILYYRIVNIIKAYLKSYIRKIYKEMKLVVRYLKFHIKYLYCQYFIIIYYYNTHCEHLMTYYEVYINYTYIKFIITNFTNFNCKYIYASNDIVIKGLNNIILLLYTKYKHTQYNIL